MKHAFLALIAVFLALAPVARAVPLHEDDVDSLIRRSRADPKRLYMLKLGASRCFYCVQEDITLRMYPEKESSPINRAYWAALELDKDPGRDSFANLAAVLKRLGLPNETGIPVTVAFKNGAPIGSITGFDIRKLTNFVADAEMYDPGSATAEDDPSRVIPKFPCGPKQTGETCFVGVSGYYGPENPETDNFGRANLKSFESLFSSPKFAALFAPPMAHEAEKNETPSKAGVFYVKNPFLSMESSFADPLGSPTDFNTLDKLPGRDVRLLLTGHGGSKGIDIGYENKGDGKHPLYAPIVLDEPTITGGVLAARKAGKTVRGVALQCYGGQYAQAFMPRPGAAIACAAFSTLPEKLSEGCYDDTYIGTRRDYLGYATRYKRCDGVQTARQLHYEIVRKSKGHDIPMLSSEYFLLYGPGADLLAENALRAPAPPGFIAEIPLRSGAVVYFDRLNNKPIKAMYKGKPIALPSTTLVDCRPENANIIAPDHVHAALFFLKARGLGPEAPGLGDCVPVFQLDWPKTAGMPPSAEAEIRADAYALGVMFDKNLKDADRQLDITGVKPEGKLLLSRLYPRYVKRSHGDWMGANAYFEKFMADLIADTRLVDPERADAMADLLLQTQNRDQQRGFNVDLPALMLGNLSHSKINENLIPETRLAHLVSSALAELELRDEAKKNPKAARLVSQLDAMRECEKDLF